MKSGEQGKASWFKFYAARWLNSSTVRSMNAADRGIFVDVICYCWTFGSIPKDPYQFALALRMHRRTAVRWLYKYSTHTLQVRSDDCTYVVRKLDVLQSISQKTSADIVRRVEKSTEDQTISRSVSKLEQETPSESEPGFDIPEDQL